jgi:endonuclease I
MRLLTFILVWLSLSTFGQIPQGYYNSADGLSGQELRAALKQIIDDHQEQSYASIWTHFLSTDPDENGMVWDMYSDVPGGNPAYIFTFIDDQCGNYGAEGDCYNREHSFPKSWFNDAAPMVTDLFQIYPTDGYVNGRRSNYPYGEVSNASWVSTNGSKLGSCSYPGYSATVFEPINEYKGDFARTYFYMMTRYMNLVSSWSSDMLQGGDLAGWAKNMLLEWDENDPVSQKEIDRNNAVYQVQDNRNPFIDHPEYVDLIWSTPNAIGDPGLTGINLTVTGYSINIGPAAIDIQKVAVYNTLGQPIILCKDCSGVTLPDNTPPGIYMIALQSQAGYKTIKIYFSAPGN